MPRTFCTTMEPSAPAVASDVAQRFFQSAPNDPHAHALIALEFVLQRFQGRRGANVSGRRRPAPRLLQPQRAWRSERLRRGLSSLSFPDSVAGADINHGHAADEFGKTLLQLLAIVVRRRLVNLRPNLAHPALDVIG